MDLNQVARSIVLAAALGSAHAAPIDIVNPSFEEDPNNSDEFFFGDPNGWMLIDPGGIEGGGDTPGTLTVTGGPFFGGVAPDGDNVAILFIGEEVGTTELGLGQELAAGLEANTHYTLSVDVGNINSGPTIGLGFFDLSGFPGYRIELLAGGVVLAETSAGIDAPIAEAEFQTVTLDFFSSAIPAQLGQALEIRLFNLNLPDPAQVPINPAVAIDLEVDFDNVQLNATIAEPASVGLLTLTLAPLLAAYRRRGGGARRPL